MKLTPPTLGQVFGHIEDKVRGIVTYRISQFEQKAFARTFSHNLPNSLKRLANVGFTVVPYFLVAYIIFSETEKEFHRRQRKDPNLYKDDK